MLSVARKLAYLAEAEAVQWLPKSALERLQLRKLRRVLQVAERVPLYRETFRKAGVAAADLRSLDDLAHFPIVTREEVIAAWPDGILSRAPREDDVVFRTSGTSGAFMRIAYDAAANDFLDAIYGRALFATGYRPWDRIAYFWWDEKPKPVRPYERIGLMKKTLLPVDPAPEKQLAALLELRPHVVYHFPSSLLLVARILERSPRPELRPRLIICHGELMTDEQQEYIGKVFGCPVYNQYGAQEFNRMAWDCGHHRGLHVDADSVRIEILRDGRATAPGEEGELVVTGLENTLMPLVRYRIGDVGHTVEGRCPCGRGLPLLKLTEGRADDVLVLPNGARIGPRTLAPRIESLYGFKQYRVIQKRPTTLEVLLVKEQGAPADVEAQVRSTIASVVGPSMSIDVRAVDEISLSRRGKLRKIVKALEA